MNKKTLRILSAWVMAFAMVVGGMPQISSVAETTEPLIVINYTDSFPGAYINTSLLTVGASYRIDFDITANNGHNGGFRVRYFENGGNGYVNNDTNNNAHSSAAAQANGYVAGQIPAQFPNGTVSANVRTTLTVNFTLGAAIPDLSPLYMSRIGIFGSSGDNNFGVNSVTLYDGAGNVIASEMRYQPQNIPGPGFIGRTRYDLGNPGWYYGENPKTRGWGLGWTDADYLRKAVLVVLEMPEKPQNGFSVIIQTQGSDWDWCSTDLSKDLWNNGSIVIDVAALNGYDNIFADNAGTVNFIIGYDPDWYAMGITAAYMVGDYSEEYFSNLSVLYQSSFESSSDGFSGRGSATVRRTQDAAQDGSSSLHITGRSEGWHGTSLDVKQMFAPGGPYYIRAFVRTETDQIVNATIEHKMNDGKSSYQGVANVNCAAGQWTLIEGEFNIGADVSPNILYFEVLDSTTANFYLDNVTIWGPKTEVPSGNETYPVGSSLKDVYSGLFSIGTAVTPAQLRDENTLWHIKQHYNSITMENAMKPQYILGSTPLLDDTGYPTLNFDEVDEALSIARDNGLKVRGHTLVWHSQTPEWFFKVGYSTSGSAAYVDKDTMDGRMEWYIKTVLTHVQTNFPGVVYAWDVVNEIFNVSTGDLRPAGTNPANEESMWMLIYGDYSFAENAFMYARMYAENGVKLFYNDFNEYIPSKRDGIYNFLKKVYAQGNIDGMGMQMHLDTNYPSVKSIEEAINKFASVGNGFEVQLTEIDVTVNKNQGHTLDTQTQYYKDLMEMVVDRERNGVNMTNVTFWGLYDEVSWRADREPLLFKTKQFVPKDAYYSVLRAPLEGEVYTGDHVIINQTYGSGPLDNSGAVSHSFVELYNPTASTVNLNGWSLQIQNGSDKDNAATEWYKLDFSAGQSIEPYSSYLIRLKEAAPSARYYVVNADFYWEPDWVMSNRAYSVALVNNQNLLSQTITSPEMSGVVDLVGALNGSSDSSLNFEGTVLSGVSKQKSARRKTFADTDDNSKDFVSVDYRTSGISNTELEELRPRWSGDGAWGRNVIVKEDVEEELQLTFSHAAGLYDKNTVLDLELATGFTKGTIWYTLDGSNPVPYARGTYRYTGAIEIKDRTSEPNYLAAIGDGTTIFSQPHNSEGNYYAPSDNIFKGNVVKAQVFAIDGTALSKLKTNSYIIKNDLTDAFGDLPIVSISLDEDDLFSKEKGIFVYGNNEQRGSEWERPAYMEFFEADGTLDLSQNLGVRINGAYSRRWPQKSLRFYASASRDPDNPAVVYDIFNGEALTIDGGEISVFNRFLLRNFGNDFQNLHMRDLLVSKLGQGLNAPTMDGRYAVALINGEFWGLYELRERVDEYYLNTKYGLGDTNVILLENPAWGKEEDLSYEDWATYEEARNWFNANFDLSSTAKYDEAQKYIDIDNIIDYFIVEMYGDNSGDWPGNNMNIWRYQTDYPETGSETLDPKDGRWRYIIKDLDFSFGQYGNPPDNQRVFVKIFEENNESTLFFRAFCTNNEFVEKFVSRLFDLMNTHLSHNNVVAEVDELKSQIGGVIEQYHERWNLGSKGEWENKLASMLDYSAQRQGYVIDSLQTEDVGYYDDNNNYYQSKNQLYLTLPALSTTQPKTLTLVTDSALGHFALNSIDISDGTPGVDNPGNWSGTYLTGLTQAVTAVPEVGYRFYKFIVDGKDEFENPLTFTMTDDTTIEAVYISSGIVQKTSPVIINQVYGCGNKTDGAISHSFIELYNTSNSDISLDRYSIQIANGKGEWNVLPLTGKTIKAKSYFLIVSNRYVNTVENPRYTISNWDMECDIEMSNRALSVALVANQTALSDIITPEERFEILNLVSVLNNPESDSVNNYQGTPVIDVSKQKSARRVNFSNTGDNASDFESIDYRVTGISDEKLAEVRPRWSGDDPLPVFYSMDALTGGNTWNLTSGYSTNSVLKLDDWTVESILGAPDGVLQWQKGGSSITVVSGSVPFSAIAKIANGTQIRYIGIEKPAKLDNGASFDGKTWVIASDFYGEALLELDGWEVVSVLHDADVVMTWGDNWIRVTSTDPFDAIAKLTNSSGGIKYIGIER